MAPANGSTGGTQAEFEAFRNDVCNAFSRAAQAMRDASHAAEAFQSWFARVNGQNFPIAYPSGSGLLSFNGQQLQPYGMEMDEVNRRKRKAGDDDEGTGKRKRKERKPKDKNAPKRAASAYILYQNEQRKAMKEEHPNLPHSELLGLISAKWKELGDEERKPYLDAHDKAKKLYETAKEAYEAKKLGDEVAELEEKPKSKSSTISKVQAPSSPDEDEEEDEEEEQEVSAAATPADDTEAESTSGTSDDESDEDESKATTPEPPKKKVKKEAKASTPPPVRKEKKKGKEEKSKKKKDV